MLVLTRRIPRDISVRDLTSQIVIGDKAIVFHVIAIKGNYVQVGIEAPYDVKICRGENYKGNTNANTSSEGSK